MNNQDILRVEGSPHIGIHRLNLQKQFPYGDPIEYENFVDGETLAVIFYETKGFSYIYKPEYLQRWFNQRRTTNPLTTETVTQDDIKLFTYEEDLTMGGRRNRKSKNRKTKRKYRHRKTRRHR